MADYFNGRIRDKISAVKDTEGSFTFDPQKSLIVSLWCSPPCLPGILAKLKSYKAVLITYNVCINIASVNPNYDISECDDYYDTQVCNYVIGEFWYLIDSFIKSFIVNFALWAFKEKLLHESYCAKNWPSNSPQTISCLGYKIYTVAGWFINLSETIDTLKEISEHKFFTQEEADKSVKDEITGQSDDDDEFMRK